MKDRDFTSARAKEALLPNKEEERYCGNCCWFFGEDTDGWGQCIMQEYDMDSMYCGDMCEDSYISRQEMRHHLAVLLQFGRWISDRANHYPAPAVDIAKAIDFAYRYIKTFSEL